MPEPLHGLMVRFLNRLEFPLDDLTDNGETLLTIAPRSPQGLDWNFINFAHQYSFLVPKSPCTASVNLFRLQDQNPTAAAMMLEVEVSITNLAAFGLDIDTALRELRRVKNEAFFHSLTQKAQSRYNPV